MVPGKKRTKQKIKRNETKERGWFWILDDNHVLYPVLYTPTTLPMIPRPGTQAFVVSCADKIVISALFASSLVRNNVCVRYQICVSKRKREPVFDKCLSLSLPCTLKGTLKGTWRGSLTFQYGCSCHAITCVLNNLKGEKHVKEI